MRVTLRCEPQVPQSVAVLRCQRDSAMLSLHDATRIAPWLQPPWTWNAVDGVPSQPRGYGVSESLLHRVAAGDTSAVAQCVDQFGGLVWSLARRLVRASDVRSGGCHRGQQTRRGIQRISCRVFEISNALYPVW